VPLLEEIVPFVYALPGSYVNVFLIAEENGLTVIDSGLKGSDRKIVRTIRELGRKPEEIRTLLITHHHADHVGSLAALLASSGAAAWAHPLDTPIIAGEKPRPHANPASIFGRIAGPLIERLPQNNPPPARPNHDATDGAVVPVAGGMQVIHTPGHTMGHVSYLMPGHGGVLFAGDAAGHVFGRLGKPALIFTEDMAAAKESIRKLAALEFDAACFGHGGVLKGKASVEFRRYVERRARAVG
jgi:glyoxylase-like metal-dependent hydrolase (beta-lactamase superfamily II)